MEDMCTLFRSEEELLDENDEGEWERVQEGGDADASAAAAAAAAAMAQAVDEAEADEADVAGDDNDVDDGDEAIPRGDCDAEDVAMIADACASLERNVDPWMVSGEFGRVHKRTICAWAGSSSENLSGHLQMRAAQAGSRACVDVAAQESEFDIQADAWIVEPGSDIAVVCDSGVHIGSIMSVIRTYDKGRPQEYTRPFDLHEARDKNWDLLFFCTWYEQRANGAYKYGVLDPTGYPLLSVACPVVLQTEGDVYRLPEAQQVLIDEARTLFDL